MGVTGNSQAYAVMQGALTQDTLAQMLLNQPSIHSLSTQTSINGSMSGRRYLTYAGGVLAITLSAPVAGTDDGKRISIYNDTTQQHTVTCTGHLQDGAGHSNTATFAAHPGSCFTIEAFNGNWRVESSNGVTFS